MCAQTRNVSLFCQVTPAMPPLFYHSSTRDAQGRTESDVILVLRNLSLLELLQELPVLVKLVVLLALLSLRMWAQTKDAGKGKEEGEVVAEIVGCTALAANYRCLMSSRKGDGEGACDGSEGGQGGGPRTSRRFAAVGLGAAAAAAAAASSRSFCFFRRLCPSPPSAASSSAASASAAAASRSVFCRCFSRSLSHEENTKHTNPLSALRRHTQQTTARSLSVPPIHVSSAERERGRGGKGAHLSRYGSVAISTGDAVKPSYSTRRLISCGGWMGGCVGQRQRERGECRRRAESGQ